MPSTAQPWGLHWIIWITEPFAVNSIIVADNFLEKQRQDFEARKSRKEAERKKRLRQFAEQYRKRKEQQESPKDV